MIESVKQAKKLFSEGILKEIRVAVDLKSIRFVMNPFSIDAEKFTEAIITTKTPIFFSIKGLSYQAEFRSEKPVDTHEMFGWGEIDESQLLKDFFSGKLQSSDPNENVYGDAYGKPEDHKALQDEFHHIYFEGFHAYIDILCRTVEVEIKKAKERSP